MTRKNRQDLENIFRRRFELELPRRVERAHRTKVHKIIPGYYFSRASSECREAYLDGHFFSCIASTQSVAEALSRFITKANKVPLKKDHLHRVDKLLKEKLISKRAADAFKRIHKKDRHAFHHLNEDIETNYTKLESRAGSCIMALRIIEAEIFAFSFVDGALSPKHPKYWPVPNDGKILISLRQDV